MLISSPVTLIVDGLVLSLLHLLTSGFYWCSLITPRHLLWSLLRYLFNHSFFGRWIMRKSMATDGCVHPCSSSLEISLYHLIFLIVFKTLLPLSSILNAEKFVREPSFWTMWDNNEKEQWYERSCHRKCKIPATKPHLLLFSQVKFPLLVAVEPKKMKVNYSSSLYMYKQ